MRCEWEKIGLFPFYVNFKGLKTGMCISDKNPKT